MQTRALIVRFIAVAMTVIVAGEPLTAGAQERQLARPGMTVQPVLIPQPGTGRIIVAPTPPPFFIPPQPPRRLEGASPPEHYIQPGIEGLYAQLRKGGTSLRRETRLPVTPTLQAYEPYRSPTTPPDAAHFNIRQIVVKFAEGSGVRLRENTLVVSDQPDATETRGRLGRSGLEPAMVASDLNQFNRIVASLKGVVARAASADQLDLQRLRQAAERGTRLEQPDLNLFYFVQLPEMRPEDAQRVLQDVQRLRSVEVAYFQPIPADASDKPPTTALNVFPSQGYLRPAPLGIDVDFARNFNGGRGQGVRIVDVESGWNIGHEDLPPLFFRYGTNFGGDHGTAVLGELAAEENAFGATGIAPQALVGWSSISGVNWRESTIYFYSVADALIMSLDALRAGDIALIEQHYPTNAGPPPNTCNASQFGFVAVETFAFEHAAISNLTGAGVVVVEAAGNGQQMVVPASPRDSGAIVVGASNGAGARAPACFTNFGPRVNLHAWGGSVGTLSYGMSFFLRTDASGNAVFDSNGMPIFDLLADPTLRANGNDSDQWYTRMFSGTSSASPIVTGAAALIQGIRAGAGLAPLSSVEMRTLLASTGTPQTPDAKNIGPLPNLRAAIAAMIPDTARFTFQSSAPATPVQPGGTFDLTVRFQNTGGLSWTGDHAVQIEPTQTGPSAFGMQSIALGSTTTPVDPNGLATTTFTLRAPTTTGSFPLGFWLRNPNGSVLATGPYQQIIVGSPPADTATLTIVNSPGQIPMGVPAVAAVTATNTGATVWTPQTHALRIWGSQNLTLSQTSGALTGPVAPGQSATFAFTVTCRASGLASYGTQMSGATSAVAGRTVSCTQ